MCTHAAQKANRVMKVIRGMETPPPVKEGWQLDFFILEKRRLHGGLTVAFQYFKEAYKRDRWRLFARACSEKTRGNYFKLKAGRFRLDIRKKFFMMWVRRHWNRLPHQLWMSHFWKCSKSGWLGLWATWSRERCPFPWQRGWTSRTLKAPSISNHSMIF